MEATVSFVNATKKYQFKAKDSEIKDNTLLKKSWIKRKCTFFFSDDFNSVDTNYVLDIHQYIMKKNII